MTSRKTAKRWIRNENDRQAVRDGCYFDEAAAIHVAEFCRAFIKHTKGEWAGESFSLLEWQIYDVVYPLFGWKQADGRRRFKVAYIEIPKKNGKSALMSALALYLLIADGEYGAEIYCAASDKKQAKVVFRETATMVENSPDLRAALTVTRSTSNISFRATNSWMEALSADLRTKDGINPHAIIFDELHTQRTPELWDKLRYGQAARRQPLCIAITTAGAERSGICWEQHQYAVGVNEGRIPDTQFFGYIRAADEDDDWASEATWFKANPSLGKTISLESFRADYREAANSPRKEAPFRRYRLCQWGVKLESAIAAAAWRKCGPPPGWTPDELDGCTCYAGLDLASTTDLAALSLTFRTDGRYNVLTRYWVPEEALDRRERVHQVSYRLWVNQGWITTTPGETIDYDVIRRDVGVLACKYHIANIAIDRWNATQLTKQLADDGFDVTPFGQGYYSMGAASKEFDRAIVSGELNHGNNPCLEWQSGNLVWEMDAAENLKPSKKRSREKIDGIVATIMAFGLWLTDDGSNQDTPWEIRSV